MERGGGVVNFGGRVKSGRDGESPSISARKKRIPEMAISVPHKETLSLLNLFQVARTRSSGEECACVCVFDNASERERKGNGCFI